MDHLSIIIVNFNTDQDTKECLRSLVKVDFKNIDYKIIVVDNGSKKPLQLSKSYLANKVKLLRSESNLGFTGGNNLGISHATKKYQSDFFLLLNSDTIVDPNFIQELIKKLKSDPKAGLVCPKIYFYKGNEYHYKSYDKKQRGKVIWYAGGSIDWQHLSSFHRGVDEIDHGQFDQQNESEFATGCCILFKREVIESIGILDKNFFLYSEDVDFSIRAKKNGFKILFAPESIIWHKNAGSSQGVGSKIHQYYQTRNRFLLTFKHGSFRSILTALKIMSQYIFSGESTQRQAVFDLIFRRLGKQQII